MTPNQYQAECLRTWTADMPIDMQLLNSTLGLVGETGELLNHYECPAFDARRAAEELGDLCYYMAVATHLLGYPFNYITDRPRTPGPSPHRILSHMTVYAAGFADHVKKQQFQGHPLDDYVPQMNALAQIYKGAEILAHALDLPMTSIFEGNIAKLAKRYPDGRFDPERSRNRNQ